MTVDTLSAIGASTLRLRGGLEVREAAAARRAVREFLDAADPAQHLVVDLSSVEELDAAGLAAVTSPVLAACRAGRAISVVPPMAARPRRVADQVGVLPIGLG
jgi:ABC-type transporter Mla MlaB component